MMDAPTHSKRYPRNPLGEPSRQLPVPQLTQHARNLLAVFRSLPPIVHTRSSDQPSHSPATLFAEQLTGTNDAYEKWKAPRSGEIENSFADFNWSGRGNHVDYAANDTVPLEQGEFLGQGANGSVYRTVCGGVAVAWKRIYCRAPIGKIQRKEIEILKKLSHRHVVQLVGTYTHKRFLGILLWPVAVCDLGTLMDDLDFLLGQEAASLVTNRNEDRWSRWEAVVGHGVKSTFPSIFVIPLLQSKLLRCFGCLAAAISYLHSQRIRHKDLKPSNVLLSFDGLWLTDFGTSTDFSEQTCSATNNGERGTPKYFAPEVAQYNPSGRAADIFSLGAMYFEMVALYDSQRLASLRELRPKLDRSYQANLSQRETWFSSLSPPMLETHSELIVIIQQMLHSEPGRRPTATELNTRLSIVDKHALSKRYTLRYHDHCCQPAHFSEEEVTGTEAAVGEGFNMQLPSPKFPKCDWSMSALQRRRYDLIFDAVDTFSTNFVSGAKASAFFSASGLPKNILTTIYELAAMRDADHWGRDGFAIVLHLIHMQYCKRDLSEIPTERPPAHIESSTPTMLVLPGDSLQSFPSSTFEEQHHQNTTVVPKAVANVEESLETTSSESHVHHASTDHQSDFHDIGITNEPIRTATYNRAGEDISDAMLETMITELPIVKEGNGAETDSSDDEIVFNPKWSRKGRRKENTVRCNTLPG